jgi:glycerol-3-phosphate acyltransferase PlsX
MKSIRLAIDVDSGDFGTPVIIAGILEARLSGVAPFKALMCGNPQRIREAIHTLGAADQLGDFEIIGCSDMVSPGENRAVVWKKQRTTAIVTCIALQKDNRADVSISAGDTAILLSAALFILGRADGAVRPALAAFLPTVRKKPVLLLDVGANLNCRPEHLVSFARLGEHYAGRFLDLPDPAVGLLNIGKEAEKGTRTISEADAEIRRICRNYIGFVEGHDVLAGGADVVVCDGFSGNVLLKVCESFRHLVVAVLGDQVVSDSVFKQKLMVLDAETYGGVPFLGINGTVLKAHGGSSSHAIANAIRAAVTAVNRNAVGQSA